MELAVHVGTYLFGAVGVFCGLSAFYILLKFPAEVYKTDSKQNERFINLISLFVASLVMLIVLALWPV